MKINFETAKWSMDSDGLWLSIQIPESMKATVKEFVVNLQKNPKKHVAEIKQYRKKRSLDGRVPTMEEYENQSKKGGKQCQD